MQTIALFIPCYINTLYPQVALSTLEVLQNQGFKVEYPANQTCCGQPFLNNGFRDEVSSLANKFYKKFATYDYIVAPSSSCISTIKYNYKDILPKEKYNILKPKVFELCEFLYDIVGVNNLNISAKFDKKVGIHNSCHGLRELHLASASELNIPHYSKIKDVLSKIEGITLIDANRDECCGFGGTFSISEADISVMMGRDRIADHKSNGVDIVCGVDMSCLMHMDAIAQKDNTAIKFVHVAQLLNGDV
jgi:L-lactate dehydrogenase complex protein LldE